MKQENPSVRLGIPVLQDREEVNAKAKSLIRRGLVTGCACGCRGDFNRVAERTEERAS